MGNEVKEDELEEFYYGDAVLIEYRIDANDEHALYCDMEGRVCHIELIQNGDDENYGNGEGAKAMSAFIEHVKEKEGVNNFYLFASYDEGYYDEPDEKGLERLVGFYERCGFESFFGISCNSDQIDMGLVFNATACRECDKALGEDDEVYGDKLCQECAIMCEDCKTYHTSSEIIQVHDVDLCEKCTENSDAVA